MILARYCAKTVFHEKLEEISHNGSLFWPLNIVRVVAAWVGFMRVEIKLEAFELWLFTKRTLGLRNGEFSGAAFQR
jgi:aarF domain-containing kinase